MATVATSTFADRLGEAVERKRSQLVVGLECVRPAAGRAPGGGGARAGRSRECVCTLLLRHRRRGWAVRRRGQAADGFFRGARGRRFAAWSASADARSAGLLVIADGKRGDIGSTARAYAAAYLEPRGEEPPLADALTVNTYLGHSVEPYLQAARLHGAGIFCLVRTSNSGAGDVQELTLSDGRRVWQHVAALVEEWGAEVVGERGLSSVGAVVGATVPRAVAEARKLLPQSVLLLPGVGAQAQPGRCRARLHERARERTRDGIALRDLRVPRGERGLALGGGCRGGASPLRDLVGLRLVMRGHATLARYAAPAAFLLAATIAVLLVRAALTDDGAATTPPAATTTLPTTTANPADTGTGTTTRHCRRGVLQDQGRRHARGRSRAVRHHGRAVDGAQPGRRPRRADDWPAHTRQVESTPP